MITLTLKNIPKELHEKLKASADRNRRSLNSEILIRLESGFGAPPVDRKAVERHLDELIAKMEPVDHSLVDEFKRRGRS